MSMTLALIAMDNKDVPEWVRNELFSVGINFKAKKCKDEAQLFKFAADADMIWTFGSNICITPAVLPELKKLRTLMRTGSGLDDLPLKEAGQLGIEVLNTPEAIAATVAEHTAALLMSAVRCIPWHDREIRDGRWKSEAVWAHWHLKGQTLGLVGFGRIAQHLVEILSGFSLRVLCYDPYADASKLIERGIIPVSMDMLLEESNFISLHCPLTPSTKNLIRMEEFRKMKPDAILINTSRGSVINQEALFEALRNGIIGGAAVDVVDYEPLNVDNPLLTLNNIIITPHVAAFSDEFEYNFWSHSIKVIKNQNRKFVNSNTTALP